MDGSDGASGTTTVEDVLAHFGVKGMRWGVRKTESSDGSSSGSSADVQRVDAVRAKIKTGGTRSLSNQELQDYITRANLERQFSNLSAPRQKAVSKFILDFMKDFGKQAARQYANEQLKALLKKS